MINCPPQDAISPAKPETARPDQAAPGTLRCREKLDRPQHGAYTAAICPLSEQLSTCAHETRNNLVDSRVDAADSGAGFNVIHGQQSHCCGLGSRRADTAAFYPRHAALPASSRLADRRPAPA